MTEAPQRTRALAEVRTDPELSELFERYAEAEMVKKEAEALFKEARDALINRLSREHQDVERIDIEPGDGTPMRAMIWGSRRHFDSKTFRAHFPDIYEQFLVPSEPSWTIKAVRG